MIRALWLFLLIAVIAVSASVIADIEGSVTIALPGKEIRLAISVAIALVIILSVVTIIFYRVITSFVDAPAEFFRWRAMGRRRRGFAAVTRGLVAVAAGDDDEARRQSRKALSLVGEPPLALLLAAQAAQMDGDDEAAQRYFTQMLQSRDTEFLGLRGLFMLAMRREDTDQAVLIAERARLLRPRTRWALSALFDLNVRKRAWPAASTAIDAQLKARLIDAGIARRRRAVLATATALEHEAAGDGEHALKCAEDALNLAPGFGPAALIAAKYAGAQGKQWRASSLIETAWAQDPHPDLARAYASIRADETSQARAKRLAALAGMNPHHPESHVLNTAVSMSQGRYEEAREHLRPLAERWPSVRVCLLMADIERALGGDSLIAKDWATRALKAPRDAQWTCASCSRPHNDWAAICSSCSGFDTMSWQSGDRGTIDPALGSDSVSAYAEASENAASLYRDTVKKGANRPSPATTTSGQVREASPGGADNVVFAAPRAPDDPGPEAEDYTQSGDDKRRKRSGEW
ncbi:MAG: heme biosynthesis HemY N-terminal domain-containing protein [Micropepsaceae bacterium]